MMTELAEQLGTSVTPIREACLRLVSEFALEIRSRRFIHVPDVTLRRYQQLRLMRMALEGLSVRLAAETISPAEISRLREIHNAYVVAERERQGLKAFRLNREFHLRATGAAGYDMLAAHVEMLWISMSPILVIYFGGMVLKHVGGEEHLILLDAFERRDGQAAQQAIRRDIELGSHSIIAHLTELESAQNAGR